MKRQIWLTLLLASVLLGGATLFARAGGATASAPPIVGDVAVIDIAYVFANYQGLRQKLKELEESTRAVDVRNQAERDQIAQLAISGKDLPPGSPERKKAEEQVALRSVQLEIHTKRDKRDIYVQETEIYAAVGQEIKAAVRRYADQQGLRLVLRMSNEPADARNREAVLAEINQDVVFARNNDITIAVLNELNQPQAAAHNPAAIQKR